MDVIEKEVSIEIPDIPETRKFLLLAVRTVPAFKLDDVAAFGPCLRTFLEPHYKKAVRTVMSQRLKTMADSGKSRETVELKFVFHEALDRLHKLAEEDHGFREQYWEAFLADCVVRTNDLEKFRSLVTDMIGSLEKNEE